MSCLWEGNGIFILCKKRSRCTVYVYNCNTRHCSISPLFYDMKTYSTCFNIIFFSSFTNCHASHSMYRPYKMYTSTQRNQCFQLRYTYRTSASAKERRDWMSLTLWCIHTAPYYTFKLQQFDWIKMHQKVCKKNIVYILRVGTFTHVLEISVFPTRTPKCI